MENNEGQEEMKLWSGRSTDPRSGSGTERSCREAEALLLELVLQCATTCLEEALLMERPPPPNTTPTSSKLNLGHCKAFPAVLPKIPLPQLCSSPSNMKTSLIHPFWSDFYI